MIGLDFTSAFNLQNSPADVLLTDITDYAGQVIPILPAQVKGNFELQNQYSGLFHANNDFITNPDIDRSLTDNYSKALPLAGSAVQNGLYTFKYTVEITDEAFAGVILSFDPTHKIFGVAGNQLTNVINANVITGQSPNNLALCGGYYLIDLTPGACYYDSVNDITYIAITAPVTSPVVGDPYGYFTTTRYSVTKTVNFCFKEPKIKLEVISDCFTNTLTASDLTNYQANDCGGILQPASISGTMLIEYPKDPTTGIPMHADEVVSINNAGVSFTVNPICTGDFQVTIDVTVVYLHTDIITGIVTTYAVQLTGYKAHSVECEEGLCCASQCIENVKREYDKAKGRDLTLATELRDTLISLMAEWMLYSIFMECGDINKARRHLANIIQIVQEKNCNCCPKTSNVPVWLTTPINSGSGITTIVTSTCGNIIVTPTGRDPITYDLCIDTDIIHQMIANQLSSQKLFGHSDTYSANVLNKDFVVYNAMAGKWVNALINMSYLVDIIYTGMATGYVLTWDAVTGKAKFIPAAMHNILENDFTPVGTGNDVTEDTLQTYTMPANTLSADGDSITIEAAFDNNVLANEFVLQNVKFDGTGLCGFNVPSAGYQTFNSYELIITRTSATTYIYEATYYTPGMTAPIKMNVANGTVTNFTTTPIVIKSTGQNSLAGVNQTVCRYQKITLNKK